MNKQSKIFVAGHRGLVGSAVLQKLLADGYENIIVCPKDELDLRNQKEVEFFFFDKMPEYVFLCAAKVGGIHANSTYRAEFIRDNLTISNNIIHAAWKSSVKKLLYLGSSCIYPKNIERPINESDLLTGPLEETNKPYAIAKIAGIEMCKAYRHQYGSNFIACMPTNLYGPNDNYHPENSHVLPALMRKFMLAVRNNEEVVTVWGDGTVQREFLFIDDLADALVFLMDNYDEEEPVNIGTGEDIPIYRLVELIGNMVGFKGQINYDSSKPNGTMRKVLDVSKIKALGWQATTDLETGLKIVYQHLQKNQNLLYE